MNDICVQIGEITVNVRTACIVQSEDKVLLCQAIGENWWFLPGGRVRAGESFDEAIARELGEEIGCPVDGLRCFAISETFFENGGLRYHEIGAYFVGELAGNRNDVQTFHENERHEWVDSEAATRLEIYPEFLRQLMPAPPSTLKHVVQREY